MLTHIKCKQYVDILHLDGSKALYLSKVSSDEYLLIVAFVSSFSFIFLYQKVTKRSNKLQEILTRSTIYMTNFLNLFRKEMCRFGFPKSSKVLTWTEYFTENLVSNVNKVFFHPFLTII